MGILDEILAEDAIHAFASADVSFEVESITYKPHSGAADRTFNAQIFRDPPEMIDGIGDSLAPILRVFVPRNSDATKGVTAVVTQRDVISVATLKGGTAEDHPVVAIEEQDGGGFMLRLR